MSKAHCIAQAFLGYACLNVFDAQDGGDGPRIIKNTINQREIDDAHIHNLVKDMQTKGKQAFTDANCISIGITKNMLANPGALITDVHLLSHKNRVAWTPLAKTLTSTLINGQHRIEANILKVSKAQQLYDDTKEAEEVDGAVKVRLAELSQLLEAEKLWGVKFFDLGKFICFSATQKI